MSGMIVKDYLSRKVDLGSMAGITVIRTTYYSRFRIEKMGRNLQVLQMLGSSSTKISSVI